MFKLSEKLRAGNRRRCAAWRARNPGRNAEIQVAARAKLRGKVIALYGGNCTCCGEDEPVFLAIDHIHGRGRAHKQHGFNSNTWKYYNWLIKLGRPRKDFRILCHNCNFAEHNHAGGCPHKIRRTK